MHMLRCPCHGLPQEPNIRYLALENLTRLALVPEVLESIREHQVWWNRCGGTGIKHILGYLS